MAASVSNSRLPSSRNFDLMRDSMLQSDELPLAEVLDGNRWEEICDAHEIDFGSDEDAIYTPAITLWALISQVLFKGEMRGCKAAVGRVASRWATLGKAVCDTNTGAYCRAARKNPPGKLFATSAAKSLKPPKPFTTRRTSILISNNTMS